MVPENTWTGVPRQDFKRLVSLIYSSFTYSMSSTVLDVAVNKTDTNPNPIGVFTGLGESKKQDK